MKKGDIVGRISYGKDVIFEIQKIIKMNNGEKVVLLKGITARIEADSPIEDLELISDEWVKEYEQKVEERFQNRIKKYRQDNRDDRSKEIIYTGKILHLDGDRKYSEKSSVYYKKIGLNAIVKNIQENKQPDIIENMLIKYKPDILVITGHDGMIKKGKDYNNVYNYRNSAHFIQTIKNARKVDCKKDLVIFAGACQSYYEGLILAGANFASSPARILIDFIDPLIVAEIVATTKVEKFLTIRDIEGELRDGRKGINGIGANGKKKVLSMRL